MGIEIRNVNKFFKKDGEDFQVLEDINLSIKDGEFISIVGASGCGKSTLLRAIAGLDPNHEGSITVDGKEVVKPERSRGMVFQEHRLFPWMTVEQNIDFVLEGKSDEEKEEIIRSHIELVGLSGFEKSLPKELSGGMAQRAGIARALANSPDVLLLDEPLGALDAFTKINLQNEIRRIHKTEKATMILVTHDIDEAVFMADRIVVMSKGPGRIQDVVDVNLPEDRDRNSEEFLKIRKKIYHEFFKSKETV